MSFDHQTFPTLTTQRLSLRQVTKADAPTIFFLRTDKEVNKYIYRATLHKNVNEAEAFIDKTEREMQNGENVTWGISLKDDPEIIGSICLWEFSSDRRRAEVGYALHPKFQNQGIMSEALKCVVNFGFEKLALDAVEAFTHYENEPSKTLLVKNNFHLIETPKDSENPNNIVYEIKNTAADKT